MQVDVASPAGGMIPVEPLSVNPIIRTAADDRFLADPVLRAKINDSLPIESVNIDAYDIVYLAGGWAPPLISVSPIRLPPRSPTQMRSA